MFELFFVFKGYYMLFVEGGYNCVVLVDIMKLFFIFGFIDFGVVFMIIDFGCYV